MDSPKKIFYVSNVCRVDELSELDSLFSLVGDVNARHVEYHNHSPSGPGFGVFEMATDQQAMDCIERYHGSAALGRTLCVTSDKPRPRSKIISG